MSRSPRFNRHGGKRKRLVNAAETASLRATVDRLTAEKEAILDGIEQARGLIGDGKDHLGVMAAASILDKLTKPPELLESATEESQASANPSGNKLQLGFGAKVRRLGERASALVAEYDLPAAMVVFVPDMVKIGAFRIEAFGEKKAIQALQNICDRSMKAPPDEPPPEPVQEQKPLILP